MVLYENVVAMNCVMMWMLFEVLLYLDCIQWGYSGYKGLD